MTDFAVEGGSTAPRIPQDIYHVRKHTQTRRMLSVSIVGSTLFFIGILVVGSTWVVNLSAAAASFDSISASFQRVQARGLQRRVVSVLGRVWRKMNTYRNAVATGGVMRSNVQVVPPTRGLFEDPHKLSLVF